MGGQESRCEEYMESLVLFSEEEQEQIVHIFKQISGTKYAKEGFAESDYVVYLKPYLKESLAPQLFRHAKSVIEHKPGEHGNDFIASDEDFLVSLAHILKGSPKEKAQLMCCLMTGNLTGPVRHHQLKQLINDLVESFEKCLQKTDALSTWRLDIYSYLDQFANLLLNDLIYKDDLQQCDRSEDVPVDAILFTKFDIEIWLEKGSILLFMMNEIFSTCFPVGCVDQHAEAEHSHSLQMFPTCDLVNWTKISTILDLPAIFFLNSLLPQGLRHQWRFLFSSLKHGESFSTFTKYTMNKGPTLIIVQDTDGHTFGGYASHSWDTKPQFGGDANCFLFSLSPVMDVYSSTGYNENFLYLNHGQQTMPNGLGMGGQLGYFGLWLDYEYGKGHSKAQPKCTTFKSPQLSAKEEFEISLLEVWGLGPEPGSTDPDSEADPSKGSKSKGSILDKDPEAMAMLTLLNRGPVSEGLREEDATATIPGQHSL